MKATTSLSLMAIAFHVAVHTALKKLRTPPAQLVLSFACSLLSKYPVFFLMQRGRPLTCPMLWSSFQSHNSSSSPASTTGRSRHLPHPDPNELLSSVQRSEQIRLCRPAGKTVCLCSLPASRSHSICVFIATFMHYFFLVAAFWMNVMSFDVARTFSTSAGIVEAGHKDVAAKRRFKFYMAYAWGIPVGIGESATGF